MKKIFKLILVFVVLFSVSACQRQGDNPAENNAATVRLTVVTTYGGNDGGRIPYENAVRIWEEQTGNRVLDLSGSANEGFKNRIMKDFESGADPDVLFYFNGADANNLVKHKKVVSIEEIRSVYGDYANEHDLEKIPVSPVDNVAYAVPTYGFWELMFANTEVLEKANVPLPDETTTWEEFIIMCEKIKKAGFTPIAVSLYEIPHYWFEYATMNYNGSDGHSRLPTSLDDPIALNWEKGLNDIKEFYEKGFFPDITLTSSDSDVWELMYNGEAAFAIDGSWKVGSIEADAPNPEDIVTCFVPGKEKRKATDIIAGVSSGWYITGKAWEDKEKQKAAVDFVSFMTSCEIIATFDAACGPASLKNGSFLPNCSTRLKLDVKETLSKATGSAPAIQDSLTTQQRMTLFANVKNIVAGNKTPRQAIKEAMNLK